MSMTPMKRGRCYLCRHWPVYPSHPTSQRCRKGPHQPNRNQDDYCGEFEPEAGRVCGTCENQIPAKDDDSLPTCRAEMLTHAHDMASCGVAWRWRGPEEEKSDEA